MSKCFSANSIMSVILRPLIWGTLTTLTSFPIINLWLLFQQHLLLSSLHYICNVIIVSVTFFRKVYLPIHRESHINFVLGSSFESNLPDVDNLHFFIHLIILINYRLVRLNECHLPDQYLVGGKLHYFSGDIFLFFDRYIKVQGFNFSYNK